MIIALQKADKENIATPANWKPGDDCIILARVHAVQQRTDGVKDADTYCLDWFLCFKKGKSK